MDQPPGVNLDVHFPPEMAALLKAAQPMLERLNKNTPKFEATLDAANRIMPKMERLLDRGAETAYFDGLRTGVLLVLVVVVVWLVSKTARA